MFFSGLEFPVKGFRFVDNDFLRSHMPRFNVGKHGLESGVWKFAPENRSSVYHLRLEKPFCLA